MKYILINKEWNFKEFKTKMEAFRYACGKHLTLVDAKRINKNIIAYLVKEGGEI